MSIDKKILGVRMDDYSENEVLNIINNFLRSDRQHYIVLPYSEFFVRVRKDEEFRDILNKADLCLADGIGSILASWILGRPLKKGRVRGVDLIWQMANSKWQIANLRVFLYGGRDGVAKLASQKLKTKNPNLNIVGVEHGFHENDSAIIDKINQTKPNLLLVGLGFPKQEKWIYNNLSKMPSVKVAIGVGGAFDYISGRVRRAPRLMQSFGLEWFWRLMIQSRRLPRIYNAVVRFPLLIIKERFKIKDLLASLRGRSGRCP